MKKKEEYVWAFDLSLSQTGISIFSQDGQSIFITSIDTGKFKTHPEKLAYIGKEVCKLHEKYPSKEIVIERGFCKFAASTEAIYKVFGVVQYLFAEKPQTLYPSTVVKKIVGGAGNIKKPELRNKILKMYPNVKFDNLDQSDSFGVGLCHFIKTGILKGDY